MKTQQLLSIGLFSLMLSTGAYAVAEETVAEKANNVANKSADTVREVYRNSKNELCELINGKMECVAKKIRNKARTAADKAKTKAEEVKDKVD